MTKFGERIRQRAAASFRCAACGEMAAVVIAVPAGSSVDMGPQLGRETYERDAVVVDYFHGTVGKIVDPETLDAVREIITSDEPDPVALRRIDWDIVPYYCPDCDLNYCWADWNAVVLFDEGFYDCSIGTCPRGHRHTVDD